MSFAGGSFPCGKLYILSKMKLMQKKIKEMLTANGFLIRVKAAGGKHNKAYEICVPFSEAEDAYEVLCEHKFKG